MRRALVLASLVVSLTPACAGSDGGSVVVSAGGAGGAGGAGSAGGAGGASGEVGAGGTFFATGGGGGEAPAACACAEGIHQSRVIVLSDDGALWSFDPISSSFSFVRDVPCGIKLPYSMAIDAAGVAWILDADSKDIVSVPLETGGGCGDPGYDPGPLQAGFGLFGMAFVARGSGDACSDLFVHSYSGSGPFGEGPGAGNLGKLDASTKHLNVLGPVDYNGGELAGTGDGRLFAFAGVNPVKLIEYSREGEKLSVLPLTGFSKTNASAFAFFGGSAYFFTEAPPALCEPCLKQECESNYLACLADDVCAEHLACAMEKGDVTDACGGLMPQEMHNCLGGPCVEECFPSELDRVSRVSRLSLGAPGAAVELVVPEAPIRIVGSGTSICAPSIPE